MSEKKPLNAMYGSKMKLDLDKIKRESKKAAEEQTQEVVEKPVVEEPVAEKIEETPEEPVEEHSKEVVDEDSQEETVEDSEEKPAEEEVVDEGSEEETADGSEEKLAEDKTSETDSTILDNLKNKLSEKEKKLSNQSSELNYLTNKVIPNLKKENTKLKGLKDELTDALEKSTRKYFDQLDINADLSSQIGKIGAEGAVNKVRADKFEAEINNIKEELEAKIDEYREKLNSVNIDDLKKENNDLSSKLADAKSELDNVLKENKSLSEELGKLREEIIEIGNYKDEVDQKFKNEIDGLKKEISSLTTQLKLKESSLNKLSNDSTKTISDLKKQIVKLEDALEKESNKGLFKRFK